MVPRTIGVPFAVDVGVVDAFAEGLSLEPHAESASAATAARAPARTSREVRDRDQDEVDR